MTTTIHPDQIEPITNIIARLGHNDPLLQELWATKATINTAANYCVETLVKQANNFDLHITLTRLRQQIQR